MKRQMQKGFTLIELMIVVAIIAILAAIAIPSYQGYITQAKEGKQDSNYQNSVRELRAAQAAVVAGNASAVTTAVSNLTGEEGISSGSDCSGNTDYGVVIASDGSAVYKCSTTTTSIGVSAAIASY